ncbi:nucleoside-diphosphate kinase [Anaerorhabdus furcosa]|uniref:Nucleoside diphosphate kinase n=1 Tax=Anaerorhabdus furcosa TaxID=118967 RepID=A0A1T4L883_9FIRM|nr:nucleoside-diphosphate kinase [Anaerorhabdus furcosa]SJZ50761.1 nucleoside diphosphate kinase [Anaerorhabdus furcosa]
MNRSYVMFKPDCIERDLSDELVKTIEENGFIIEKSKEVLVDEDRILQHYAEVIERLNSESFKQSILNAFVGKKVIAMQITNNTGDCIAKFRELLGPTDPAKAAPTTIRGKYGNDSMEKSKAEGRMLNNLVHASDSEENAEKELMLWFN